MKTRKENLRCVLKAKRETSTRQAPTWLNDAVYEPRRQRTLAVVKQAVDTLLEQRKLDGRTRISLTTIVAMSKQQDPQGRGIAHTAILENAEAYTYDKKHRTAAPKTEKRSSQRDVSKTSEPTSSEDPSHAKRRWHYMT